MKKRIERASKIVLTIVSFKRGFREKLMKKRIES